MKDLCHVQVGSTSFAVKPEYSNINSIVGKGSYGVVVSSTHNKTHEKVAIKKIILDFDDETDLKHALREIRLLRYLKEHDNIVTLKDLSSFNEHAEIYIYMDKLDSDLHRVIQSKQSLTGEHHRYFMYQILKAVELMHDQNMIHRDLKPGNILVNKNCDIKISDFGMARLKPSLSSSMQQQNSDQHNSSMKRSNTKRKGADVDQLAMTQHVVTRWYRPPELMLHPDGMYSDKIDMWSIGCIFAELVRRKPLFPGKNFVNQLTLILETIGGPTSSEVSHITSRQANKFLQGISKVPKKPLHQILFNSSSNKRQQHNNNDIHTKQEQEQILDIIEQMLRFDPEKRISATEALNHPYFEPLRDVPELNREFITEDISFDFDFESDEFLCPSSFSKDEEKREQVRLEKLKELISQEIKLFDRNDLDEHSFALKEQQKEEDEKEEEIMIHSISENKGSDKIHEHHKENVKPKRIPLVTKDNNDDAMYKKFVSEKRQIQQPKHHHNLRRKRLTENEKQKNNKYHHFAAIQHNDDEDKENRRPDRKKSSTSRSTLLRTRSLSKLPNKVTPDDDDKKKRSSSGSNRILRRRDSLRNTSRKIFLSTKNII